MSDFHSQPFLFLVSMFGALVFVEKKIVCDYILYSQFTIRVCHYQYQNFLYKVKSEYNNLRTSKESKQIQFFANTFITNKSIVYKYL